MKNLTKLLMAVVLMTGVACTSDITEDLAPVLPGQGGEGGEVVTLQVSLPAPTRTELGDKTSDGKYPVYWCEDDCLAVNGKPTTNIAIQEDNRSVAIFDLPLGITIPYHIVYPYAGADVTVDSESGKLPVVFATEQAHTEGSFAPQSAPMYAYTDGFSDIEMQHLATALRFSIKAKDGEQVNLKYVSVSTVEAEPISGEFDVDCTTGEIAPRKSAISSVFYNFENDSYNLTSEVSEFYIAIPKGEYSRFEVNFVRDNGEVCVETFDASDDKQLKGGKVREFPTITFEANSKMYLIGTDVDMMGFAELVQAGTFNESFDGALLVADVDMSNQTWVPVEGFTSVFEGRNYAITGLKAPLFGLNTLGTISNVVVEANIVEETVGVVGVIARSLSADENKVGTIFNCTAKGSIEYNNSTLEVKEGHLDVNIGGVVGTALGGSISLTESEVAINVNCAAPQASAVAFKPCVGGIVGYADAKGEILPVITENTNEGNITWNDNSGATMVTPYVGGVTGYILAGTFTDNKNTGVQVISTPMYDLDWGGVVATSAVAVERCKNEGTLNIDVVVDRANIGGVVGRLKANSLVDCENNGIILADANFVIKTFANIAGVIAQAEEGVEEISNCKNAGDITYLGNCEYVSRSANKGNASLRIAGVAGLDYSRLMTNCENTDTAEILVKGSVASNDGSPSGTGNAADFSGIAGVVASRCGMDKNNPHKIDNCKNYGDVTCEYEYRGNANICAAACIGMFDSDEAVACENDGSIVVKVSIALRTAEGVTTNRISSYIAGLFGRINSDCNGIRDCVNRGDVLYDEAQSGNVFASGIASQFGNSLTVKLENCSNYGNVKIGKDATGLNMYAAGILASTRNVENIQYPNCTNHGNVESEATAQTATYIGSIFGLSDDSDEGLGTSGVENSGRVIFSGKSQDVYIGGYAGYYDENSHTVEFTNTASGSVICKGEASNSAYVGGYAGYGTMSTGGNIPGQNAGAVSFEGYASKAYVSGGFGYITVTRPKSGVASVTGLSNSGRVFVPALEDGVTAPQFVYLGGLFGYANTRSTASNRSTYIIKECENSGEVAYYGTASDAAYIGGIAGRADKAPLVGCINSGSVISDGIAGDTWARCTNPQKYEDRFYNVLYPGNASYPAITDDFAVGGIVGWTNENVTDCSNNGAITHTCNEHVKKMNYLALPVHTDDERTAADRFDVGGIVGRYYTESTAKYDVAFTGCSNTAVVTIDGVPASTTYPYGSIDLNDSGGWDAYDVNDADRTDWILYYRNNVGGIIGRIFENNEAHSTFTISNCTNTGLITAPNAGPAKNFSMGGIAGEFIASHIDMTANVNKGKVTIENAGNVQQYSYYIFLGGIVGRIFDGRWSTKDNGTNVVQLKTYDFTNCENYGDIDFKESGIVRYSSGGGIAGDIVMYSGDVKLSSGTTYYEGDVTFSHCKNYGNVSYYSPNPSASGANYNYSYGGGIIGKAGYGHNSFTYLFGAYDLVLDHCENHGSIQYDRNNGYMSFSQHHYHVNVGGMVGYYSGGFVTPFKTFDNPWKATFISCKNTGRIWGYIGYFGGIIGWALGNVTVTGTPEDPTINTGDIVVKRDTSGEVLLAPNTYGTKGMYSGGIIGHATEKSTSATSLSTENFGYGIIVENCVNEGAVGATTYAGGIAGYYFSAGVRGGLYNCRSTGNIYALEGATQNVGAIIGLTRTIPMTMDNVAVDHQVGVRNCQVGGNIVRTTVSTEIMENNYWNYIYGEMWNSDNVSVVEGKDYDGCTFYKAPVEDEPVEE